MSVFILAIDQGTTGTTALILDEELNIQGKETQDFPQYYPRPGWVEHDLNEIWASVQSSVERVFEKTGISCSQIAAIGITNQRETTAFWQKDEAGTPLGRAIVWQDRRTAALCQSLKKRGLEKAIQKKTGLLLDPYFSATKIQWRLQEDSKLKKQSQKGEVCFGTIDSYLLYRLTKEHATDVSNASRTLLMNLKTRSWDPDLLKLFKVPESVLPEIKGSATLYGKTRGVSFLPDGIPVSGIAGDQQAALFGQACFKKGNAKCTYGTGAFALVNTGATPIYSKNRMLTTMAWELGGKPTYALEGSAFIAGAAVQWLRDGLSFFKASSEIEELARSVESSEGVLFVPALSGMGAPHWVPGATGLLTGITRGSHRGHIARATLEGIAHQVRELLTAMKADLGQALTPLKVDGGAAANNLLLQIQADFLKVPVVRSQVIETTALGAALQAGLGVGLWESLDEINQKWKEEKRFTSQLSEKERKTKISHWEKAVQAIKTLS